MKILLRCILTSCGRPRGLRCTLPGGQAKWVQSPRGAATVSGKRIVDARHAEG
jgi:hypothetical protein